MSSSLWFRFIADFCGAALALAPDGAALPPESSAQRTALLADAAISGRMNTRISLIGEQPRESIRLPRESDRATICETITKLQGKPSDKARSIPTPPQVNQCHPIRATSDTGSIGRFVFGNQDLPTLPPLSLSRSAAPRSILRRHRRRRSG